MIDPDAMRELKQSNPEAWKKLNETRSKVYESHDAELKEWIENNVPEAEGKQVEIASVGTADASIVTTGPAT